VCARPHVFVYASSYVYKCACPCRRRDLKMAIRQACALDAPQHACPCDATCQGGPGTEMVGLCAWMHGCTFMHFFKGKGTSSSILKPSSASGGVTYLWNFRIFGQVAKNMPRCWHFVGYPYTKHPSTLWITCSKVGLRFGSKSQKYRHCGSHRAPNYVSVESFVMNMNVLKKNGMDWCLCRALFA